MQLRRLVPLAFYSLVGMYVCSGTALVPPVVRSEFLRPGSAPSVKSEKERRAALETAEDEVDVFDNATLDELAEMFEIERWPKISSEDERDMIEQATSAPVRITVSLSRQVMNVDSPELKKTWPVSTGLDQPTLRTTPGGPFFLQRPPKRLHLSSRYPVRRNGKSGGAPMPFAMFFNGAEAIHATKETRALGRKASHGCVRLSPKNAETLFDLVSTYYAADPRSVVIYIQH